MLHCVPRSDDEQSLALLRQPIFGHIDDLVSQVVAGVNDVIHKQEEVVLVLLIRCQAKSLLQGCNPRLQLLEDWAHSVDGIIVSLIVLTLVCAVPLAKGE